jgi:hypothetical protein
MKTYHWVGILVVIALAYYAGTKGLLTKAKGAVSGAVGGV